MNELDIDALKRVELRRLLELAAPLPLDDLRALCLRVADGTAVPLLREKVEALRTLIFTVADLKVDRIYELAEWVADLKRRAQGAAAPVRRAGRSV
jgi:hypothetical protein